MRAPRFPIWDAPTRIFHWALAASIGAAWWTGENGLIEWHSRIGMVVLALLLFRLLWGLIGGSTARFAVFVRGPRSVLDYVRGLYPPHAGHNPLGALSVIGLLGVTAGVVGLGLFAVDEDGLWPGPLSRRVSADLSESATELHEHQAFDLLLVLMVLHVTAIAYYLLVKRKNLVTPMISGRGTLEEGASPLRQAPVWRAWSALAVTIGATFWIWSGAPL